jgi:predicted AlkP superfamily phosphohydrolase/phosphomutase
VFDTSDRVQHMFHRPFRHDGGSRYSGVIEDLYRRMDALVGKTLKYVDDQTVLFVLSDHGFAAFDRCVNLNSWLREKGYLALKDGAEESGDFFQGVDWSRTRAYTFGLAGIYINQRGREAHGTVAREDADALRRELAAKLTGLRDEESGRVAINHAWPSESLYKGPYLEAAPDLIIGYNDGYRSSWEAAVGKTTVRVFYDNPKAWSGDHCIDPRLVPGVLFSNRKFDASDPGIEDMAPTALALFGVKAPAHMEGRPLL